MANLNIHAPTDRDWFQFQLDGPGGESDVIRLGFEHSLGNLDMTLYDSDGRVVTRAAGQGNTEEIRLAGLPRGTYYLEVFGVGGATNPAYTLAINYSPPTAIGPDWAEDNNEQRTAEDLRTVEGTRVLTDLSIHAEGDRDWFAFTTNGGGAAGHFVRVNFNPAQGDLDLALYGAGGNLLARSEGRDNFEELSLDGRPAGTYYVEVYGYRGQTNPQYTLTLNTPARTVAPDGLEPNNSFDRAPEVPTTTGTGHLPALTIHPGDEDYFRFRLPALGTAAHAASIQFDHALGDLQLELYDANRTRRGSSTGQTDTERIALQNLPAGDYFLRVFGNGASVANRYRLSLDVPTAPTTPTDVTVDDWTILVYMTASNLAGAAYQDLNEMELAASRLPATVNFAVFLDQSSQPEKGKDLTFATGNGNQPRWGDAGRAIIQPDTSSIDARKPENRIVTTFDRRLGEVNSGHPDTLVEFIRWAVQEAPARHYALVLWDHGDGVFNANQDDFDGGPADYLLIPEVAEALRRAGTRFDLVAFDSCLMAMAEIGYTLRDLAPVLVASEENMPGWGNDFSKAYVALQQNPGQVTAETLASGMVTSYQELYRSDSKKEDTLSATRSSGNAGLAAAVRAFTDLVVGGTTPAEWAALAEAHRKAAGFPITNPKFRDLGQFMNTAANDLALRQPLRDAAREVARALDGMVLNKTADQRRVSGLSIYFPGPGEAIRSSYAQDYTEFFNATGWLSFLQQFTDQADTRGSSRDWAESNNSWPQAYDLRQLVGPGHSFTGLSLHDAVDQDWFRFTLAAAGTAAHRLTVTADAGEPLQVELSYQDSDGRLTSFRQAASTTGQVQFDLAGAAADREYFLQVRGGGTAVARYTIALDAPTTAVVPRDWARGNDTANKARDLGTVLGREVFSGLTLEGGGLADWFTFATPRQHQVIPGEVVVRTAGGTVATLELFDADGGRIATVSGSGEVRLPYTSGSGATYQLAVTGQSGAYALRFTGQTQVQFAADAVAVNEAAGLATVRIQRLGDAEGTVSVRYATGDGTATAGQDYTAVAGLLTFAPGETLKTVTVPIANDPAGEANETFRLTLSNPAGAVLGLSASTLVTVADDDVRVVPPPPVTGPRPVAASVAPKKVGRKRKLVVRVQFADGATSREIVSPFQKPAFRNILVSLRDGDGDGIADSLTFTARKGKKRVTRVIPL